MTDNVHDSDALVLDVKPIDARMARVHALRMEGVPWRRIGDIVGADHSDLWREYRLCGLSTAKDSKQRLEKLQAKAYDIAEDALDHASEVIPELKGMQRVIAAGIMVDKVTNLGRALQGGESGNASPLEALLGHLGPQGGTVTMSVEPNRVIEARVIEDDE